MYAEHTFTASIDYTIDACRADALAHLDTLNAGIESVTRTGDALCIWTEADDQGQRHVVRFYPGSTEAASLSSLNSLRAALGFDPTSVYHKGNWRPFDFGFPCHDNDPFNPNASVAQAA